MSSVQLTLVPTRWKAGGFTYGLAQEQEARALRPLYGERVFAKWWDGLDALGDGTVEHLAAASPELAAALQAGRPEPWDRGFLPVLAVHAPDAFLASAKPALAADLYRSLELAVRASQEARAFFDTWAAEMTPFRSAECWPADVEIWQTAGAARWPHVLTQVGLYGAVPPIVSRALIVALRAAGIASGYSTADAILVSQSGDRVDTHVALFVEEDLAVRPLVGDPNDPWAAEPWLTLARQPGQDVAIRHFSGGLYVREDAQLVLSAANLKGLRLVPLERDEAST